MNALRLKVEPEMYRRYGVLWMLILEIYWACLVMMPTAAAIQVMTVVISVSLAAAAWRAGAALTEGARVLGTLCTPRTLWQAWLRKVLTTLVRRWALAVAAGTIAVMLHGSTWVWSGPLALCSLIVLATLVASIAHHGLWHWAWPWSIGAAFALLVSIAGWDGLSASMQAPPVIHLALACLCVGAVAAVLLRWRDYPSVGSRSRQRRGIDPARRCVNYLRRFSLLKLPWIQAFRSKNNAWLGLTLALPVAYIMIGRTVAFKPEWGATVSSLYLPSLFVLIAFAHVTVACKDLHWRRLLAPHGLTEGKLGWHIIASTLAVNAGVAALIIGAVGALLASLHFVGIRIGLTDALHTALAYSAIVPEYLTAVCIAAALRAIPRLMIVYLPMFVAFFYLALGGVIGIGPNLMRHAFVIGPAYVACLIVVAGAAILLANRLWTIQRLLPFIVTRAPQTPEADIGGRWFYLPGQPYQ